jgi:hypothetical protein
MRIHPAVAQPVQVQQQQHTVLLVSGGAGLDGPATSISSPATGSLRDATPTASLYVKNLPSSKWLHCTAGSFMLTCALHLVTSLGSPVGFVCRHDRAGTVQVLQPLWCIAVLQSSPGRHDRPVQVRYAHFQWSDSVSYWV